MKINPNSESYSFNNGPFMAACMYHRSVRGQRIYDRKEVSELSGGNEAGKAVGEVPSEGRYAHPFAVTLPFQGSTA